MRINLDFHPSILIRDGVAPRERAVQADAKERGGENEIEGEWDHLITPAQSQSRPPTRQKQLL
jgi:hypothetical protein